MVRHVVLMSWKSESTPEQRAAAIAQLQTLPSQVPELRVYTVEENIGSDNGNYDLAVIAEVDDLDAYASYRDNQVHQAMLRDSIRPLLENRAALQISG
jgi:hypothetical protein